MQHYFDGILRKAVRKQATDIYFKISETHMTLAIMSPLGYELMDALDLESGAALIRYVKYQSHLDLAESRRPQAGHWCVTCNKQILHLRTSTVGDFKGAESLVIRIIYPLNGLERHMQQNSALENFGFGLVNRTGLMIIGGAMGAGKSTTMAYLIDHFLVKRSILSIEDPVEIEQPAVLQLQVNVAANMTYPNLLKLALRHHPQVIVIGEIRDTQTAKVVVEAALSGHLILTTVHALGLAEIKQRLVNLGVRPDDFELGVTGIAFQERTASQLSFSYQFLR